MDNKYDKWGYFELLLKRKEGKKERKLFFN